MVEGLVNEYKETTGKDLVVYVEVATMGTTPCYTKEFIDFVFNKLNENG